MTLGQWDKAAAEYTKAIELKPDSWEAWSGRAFVHFSRQEWEKAVSDFSKAIDLAPQVHTNWLHRGHVYLRLAQWDKAAANFGKVVDQWPNGSEGWYLRAVAFAQLNQPDKALADLRQAIGKGFYNLESLKNDPRLATLRTRDDFAKLLEELERNAKKKLDDAIVAYRKAIDLDPKSVSAHNNLGYALQTQGKLEEAIACYRRSIELDPKSAWAHNRLGNALMKKGWDLANCPDPKLGDPKRAVEACKEAVELAPQSVLFWQYLGWVQYRAGDWKASIEALEKSCKLENGGDCGQWIVLSMSHGKLASEKELPKPERDRHKTEARRWYHQAVKQIDNNWRIRPSNSVSQAIWDFRVEAAEFLGVKENQK